MIITDDARTLLQEILKGRNCNALKVTVKPSCCGTAALIAPVLLEEGAETDSVNGIPVQMEEAARVRTEFVTLDTKDGTLVIRDEQPSTCSC